MGVYLYLHREDPRRIADFEEGRLDSWNYFRFDIPDNRKITASTPECTDLATYTSLDLDKYWDLLLFMLSEPYRREVSPQSPGLEDLDLEDPLYWAIAGARVANYSTRQEQPLRYSTARQVKQIADALEPVTFDDLRPFADGATMRQAGIYRSSTFSYTPQEDVIFSQILRCIKLHYRNTDKNNQIMIHEWV